MYYLLVRFLQMLVILFTLSIALFGLLNCMPGDPIDMLVTSNPNISPQDVERLKKLRGLDKPLHIRYFRWLWGYHDPDYIENGVKKTKFNEGFIFVFLGNHEALGYSNTYKRPVWELLMGSSTVCTNPDKAKCQNNNLSEKSAAWLLNSGRIGNTLQLMLPAILLSLLIAIPLGILSAYKHYSWLDYLVNFLAFMGISLPVFWFAIMVLFVFAEYLQWFPAGGMYTPGIEMQGFWITLQDKLQHAILPTIVLSIAYTGQWLRYMRAAMLEVLPADYIRTARAKGLSESTVLLKHAMRNALIPVVTILTLSIPALFGGAVLTETVFAWPGIGRLQYEAVLNSDYYLAIVVFLISAALVMLGNLLADIVYVWIDPRIRYE